MNAIETHDWRRFCDRLAADGDYGAQVMGLASVYLELKSKVAEGEARIAAGHDTPELIAAMIHARRKAREAYLALFAANVPLVHHHVNRLVYGHAAQHRDDAIQVGLMALMRAIELFDDRGSAFSTYASVSIINAINRWAGRECRKARRFFTQIDDDAMQPEEQPDSELDRWGAQQLANECAKAVLENECGLTERERDVLILHFGIGDGLRGQTWTLKAIGDRYGITKEGIRQVQKRALRKVAQEIDRRRN